MLNCRNIAIFYTYHNWQTSARRSKTVWDISGSPMSRLSIYVIAVLVVSIAAGVVALATWDIPAPATAIEIVLPNDRFPN